MKMKLSELVRFCDGTLSGDDVTVTSISSDTRQNVNGGVFIAVDGEKFDGHDFLGEAKKNGAVACVIARGRERLVPEGLSYVAVDDTVFALGMVARAYRMTLKAKIVAVTGSVGKTTTKDMIAAALSGKYKVCKTFGNYNNHIGLPKTLLSIPEDCEYAVVEMGMSALGEISYLTKLALPDMAVITNIGVSHLEKLKTRENIFRAKLEVIDGMCEGTPLFINSDNDILSSLGSVPGHPLIRFGENSGDIRCSDIEAKKTKIEFTVTDGEFFHRVSVPAIGAHNAANAVAAYCIAKTAGMTFDEYQRGIETYVPSDMRQKIIDFQGIKLINDCYNASPDSMRAALCVLRDTQTIGRRVAVLGDMLELGDISESAHRQIGEMLCDYKVDYLLAVGTMAKQYCIGAMSRGTISFWLEDNAQVAEKLKYMLREGDTVLFKSSRRMKLEEIISQLVESEQ